MILEISYAHLYIARSLFEAIPHGKTSTDVDRTTLFGPVRKFPDVLIRRRRRKDVASTLGPNWKYD